MRCWMARLIYQEVLSMYLKTNSDVSVYNKNKDEQILAGRLSDLAKTCYNRNIPVFSGFLNLNEQNILNSLKNEFSDICILLDGGYEYAERRIAVFLPYEGYDYQLPVSIIKIEADKRFADNLTHRDFLGALMNLGIERSLLGDIIISDGAAYVFCLEKISGYILDNLTRVRNDYVRCTGDCVIDKDFSPSYKEITGSVASLRLDAMISLAFGESRSHSVSAIEGGLVFINGKLITTNAYNLKEGEIISVRGKGRFRYMYTKGETKKGRYMVVLKLYV